MKKLIRAFSAIICATLLLTTVIGCSEPTQQTPIDEDNVVNVYVIGGEGSGRYLKDTNCKVTAIIPEGKQFMYWEEGGEQVSPNAEYIFTVTEDVTLFAVFADGVPNANKKAFSVNIPKVQVDGQLMDSDLPAIGAGKYLEGSTCTVSLNAEDMDRTFDGWASVTDAGVVGDILSTDKSYSFEVTKDVNVIPVFKYGIARINAVPDADMARVGGAGALEFDRGAGGTVSAFYDKGSDKGQITAFVKFRIYDNENAEGDAIGEFVLTPYEQLDMDRIPEEIVKPYEITENMNLITAGGWFCAEITSGDKVIGACIGGISNYYIPGGFGDMNSIINGAIEVTPGTTYYVTAQICGPGKPILVNGVLTEVIDGVESGVCKATYTA